MEGGGGKFWFSFFFLYYGISWEIFVILTSFCQLKRRKSGEGTLEIKEKETKKKKHCWFQNFGLHCGINASEKADFLKNEDWTIYT